MICFACVRAFAACWHESWLGQACYHYFYITGAVRTMVKGRECNVYSYPSEFPIVLGLVEIFSP